MMFLIILVLFYMNVIHSYENEIKDLSANFKENLRADPFLQENADFQSVKLFIDKKLDHFGKNVVWRIKNNNRSKRSLSDMSTLADIKLFRKIPVTYPQDIIIFFQLENTYAIVLEEHGEIMKIKKSKGDSFISIVERKIPKTSKVAAFSRKSGTIIVVAINSTTSTKWSRKNVFIFHNTEKLEPIQIVNTPLITDIAIWEDQNDLFMSGCSAADFPLYKWRGQHFDVVQTITGAGTTKITPFRIHNVAYIAIANTEPSDGSGRVFSHILRYDFKTEIYKLYQRLETFACIDIKYFQIISERNRWDHFIVVGNGYQVDHLGNITYNTRSIIYKYIDGYFIPFQSIFLNGLREWLPIEIENGDVILLALTLDGLRSFHYDGWRFIEGQVRFLDVVSNAAFRDVTHMNSYKIENKTVLVLADARNNGLIENMFTITVTKSHQLEREYNDLLEWCQENTKKVKNVFSKNVGEARRGDDDQVLVIESQTGLNNVDIMKTTLEAHESRLSIIKEKVQRILLINNNHTIRNNMTISNLILHNTGGLKKLHTERINKIPVNDVLTNTLNVNKGFNSNLTIEFTSVQVEETIIPKYINDMELSRLQHTTDTMEIDELSINGTISCEQETVIDDKMNDMLFDNSHLLKSEEDQDFDTINIQSIDIVNLTVNNLNNVDLQVNKTIDTRTASIRNAIDKLETFKVQELTVGGYVNGLDVATINKYSLRQGGDQVISKTHVWEQVDTDNINIQNLSGKKLENNIVTITPGNYTINKDVKFIHNLNVDSLRAFKYLAGLTVKDGRLDIMLRDSEEMQYISGTKSFENLHLLNPVNLQGKIKGEPFDAMNPAVQIDSALEVNNGTTKIAGNVIVEELIITKDIMGMRNTDETNSSLFRVIDHGVKLVDAVVPINLRVSKHINVKELFTDMINNLNPNEWLVTGGKEAQTMRYEKYFPGDLEITGDIEVHNMNNVDMGELQTNVLRKDGDQTISGKHNIKYVATEKSIITNNTKFGEKKWTDVVTTSGAQEITGPVIFVSNVVSTSIKVTNLETRGLTNHLSFVDLVKDAYTYNSDKKLLDTKKFVNLTIEDLFITKVNQHLVSLASGIFILKYLMNVEALSVKNIQFNDKFNAIDKEFIWNHRNSNKTLTGVGNEFGTITIHGQVFLKSNHVNRLDMQDFQNKTVKTDEQFEFDSVKIDRIITRDAVQLGGQIENLDLNNVFLNMDLPQHFANEKITQGNISVLGNVRINDSLNNVDISDICGYDSHTPKDLIFEGNIQFAKGPDIFILNGAQARNLIEKVWYSDKPAIIKGNIRFNSNSTFMDIITVQGIVNDFDVNFLLKSYMSKTRDQIVEAQMHFIDELTFEQDIASPDLQLNGNVNEIQITNLPRRILLNRAQVFEGMLYLENCKVMSASGDYLVNTLNLERDVMRYDKPNLITGPKRFRNIEIDILRTFDRNIVVQNVDMNYWLANAIQTTGNFRISENKLFGSATYEKGIGLKGTMNGLKFSKKSIMSKTEPQIITGRKLFKPVSMDIKFKVLKVKGYLNEIDVGELIHNQASLNGVNVFRSPIVFGSNVTTKNINFRSLYQGINITEFIRNVTALESLNDLNRYYEDLLDMSNKIESSLEDQASYLNYFKRVYFAPRNATLYPSYKNKKTTIMSLTNENGSFTLNFLDWNENLNIFENIQGYSINLGLHPSFFEKVSHGKRDYIYLEYPPMNADDKLMHGKLIHIENSTNFHSFSFQTKGTTYLTSFYMEIAEYNCLLFIDYSKTITIMCADSKKFHFHQDIPLENVSKATTMTIDSSLYLIALSSVSSEENHVTTWKLNNCTLLFEHDQTIQVARGVSMDTASFFNNHFLAIVHGYLENTLDFGKVEILKFNRRIAQFSFNQRLLAAKPNDLKFATLPSRELVLYVSTSTDTLNVYIYEGIAGFTKKAVNAKLPKITDISHFNTNNQHFVILKCNEEIEMLQAVFKGQYVEDQRFQ